MSYDPFRFLYFLKIAPETSSEGRNITSMCSYIGRGARRNLRVLLLCFILLFCVAHLGLIKVQLQARRAHRYYEGNGSTLNDSWNAPDLRKDSIVRGRDRDFEASSKDAEGALEQGGNEEYLLPTRTRALNQLLYKKDSIKRLNGSWTNEKRAEWQKVLKGRLTRLQEACRTSNLTGSLSANLEKVYTNLRWVPKHSLVWCPIYKAASTTWVKQLLVLAGIKKLEESLHGTVKRLYPVPKTIEKRDWMLQNFMKLIIVRHPFERLLSAYRDKMLRVKSEYDPFVKMQQQISERYKNLKEASCNTTAGASSTDHNTTHTHPSFTQFLHRVRDDVRRFWNKEHKSINQHWRPFLATCAPCHINYDVVAHVETLDWDQEYIINELELHDILLNAHTHASNFDRYNGTSEATRSYFSQVPKSLLKTLAQLYELDFKLFGYSPENYLKMAKRDYSNSTHQKCDTSE